MRAHPLQQLQTPATERDPAFILGTCHAAANHYADERLHALAKGDQAEQQAAFQEQQHFLEAGVAPRLQLRALRCRAGIPWPTKRRTRVTWRDVLPWALLVAVWVVAGVVD